MVLLETPKPPSVLQAWVGGTAVRGPRQIPINMSKYAAWWLLVLAAATRSHKIPAQHAIPRTWPPTPRTVLCGESSRLRHLRLPVALTRDRGGLQKVGDAHLVHDRDRASLVSAMRLRGGASASVCKEGEGLVPFGRDCRPDSSGGFGGGSSRGKAIEVWQDWAKYQSRRTGKSYWYNKHTRVTQWKDPRSEGETQTKTQTKTQTETQTQTQAMGWDLPTAATPTRREASNLSALEGGDMKEHQGEGKGGGAGDWTVHVSSKSGQPYWFNRFTGKSRWTDPRLDAKEAGNLGSTCYSESPHERSQGNGKCLKVAAEGEEDAFLRARDSKSPTVSRAERSQGKRERERERERERSQGPGHAVDSGKCPGGAPAGEEDSCSLDEVLQHAAQVPEHVLGKGGEGRSVGGGGLTWRAQMMRGAGVEAGVELVT